MVLNEMKFLYITHLSGRRVNRIWLCSLIAASQLGFEVHLACNMEGIDQKEWDYDCEEYNIISHHIPFDRMPLRAKNIHAYIELKKLLDTIPFDLVHCNTPIGGVIGRICAHNACVKHIIYQAHGFHFYRGAPLRNWIMFYPVERYLSRYTDVLITINSEDYKIANSFNAGRVCYVPGVGIDIKRFSNTLTTRADKRHELNLNDKDIVLLSIGELIPRKNHSIVIKALSEMRDAKFFNRLQYVICGQGALENELTDMANILGLSDKIHFLGYRSDISEICHCSDLFIFPSLQEGLPVALMEAMASGLPVICSNIRGNTDLITDGQSGCIVENNAKELAVAISNMISDELLRAQYAAAARKKIQQFDLGKVETMMCDIYTAMLTDS